MERYTFKDLIGIVKQYTSTPAEKLDDIKLQKAVDIVYTQSSEHTETAVFVFKLYGTIPGTARLRMMVNDETEAVRINLKVVPEQNTFHEMVNSSYCYSCTDTVRTVLTQPAATDHIRRAFEAWSDIVHELVMWHSDRLKGDDFQRQVYEFIKQGTPEICQSLVRHGIFSEEIWTEWMKMRDAVLSGDRYPNLNHCMEKEA